MPLYFTLSPISTLAMGKDPMTAGNSFTCFLKSHDSRNCSLGRTIYIVRHTIISYEFITVGLLIELRLSKIQRLYSATIHISADE